MKGAEVIYQDTHVSGHACQEEIKLMYSLVRPKYLDSGTRRVPPPDGAGATWQFQWAFRRKMSS